MIKSGIKINEQKMMPQMAITRVWFNLFIFPLSRGCLAIVAKITVKIMIKKVRSCILSLNDIWVCSGNIESKLNLFPIAEKMDPRT